MSDASDASAVSLDAESEWVIGADGLPYRDAARVVVMDRRGRIFLIHGHDIDDVNHHWWFTVGGGLLSGEDAREGAQRELAEETGLRVSPERLEGPVLRRSALFHFVGETRRQDETFFLLFLDDDEAA
ncbi:MAG: NUDIX domain-containing protein, partial [Actinomycetaceae bacterium]|nr:NUDIX domain-containing protein [Actinomycetaceae bacterium]